MSQAPQDRFTFSGPDQPPAGAFKPLARLLVAMAAARREREQEERDREERLAFLSQFDELADPNAVAEAAA